MYNTPMSIETFLLFVGMISGECEVELAATKEERLAAAEIFRKNAYDIQSSILPGLRAELEADSGPDSTDYYLSCIQGAEIEAKLFLTLADWIEADWAFGR